MLPVPSAPTDPDIVARRWTQAPRNVQRARAELSRHLAEWGCPAEVIDSAVVVLSELPTNAMRHAGEPRGRHIETRFHRGDFCVRIDVHDANDAKPERREASDEDESGRGLELVDALTSGQWGISSRVGVGKMVWAICAYDGAPDLRDAAAGAR
ncbi:ATP-binding protein [Actinacidiphila paucisporea]|uniref:Anti-sigma regulatory factor (Ser/Thr protein kinase) n=1 Tax=Actinacidiphila paucisporea TaxID=310782 RepID=A0A1M6XST3_9ACTN|nr:ATP-binding protein [Actinacidiphila paucisporea]SHL09014.1 Anti-sigma regulatory factor (Ser/Thr protein kinase) [Actinacidiphila paucisporea]